MVLALLYCAHTGADVFNGTEEKENAVGAYRESPLLTAYCAFGSTAARRFALLPPSRHDDSRVLRTRQSCRFLETASLHPPQAALRLFPLSAAAGMAKIDIRRSQAANELRSFFRRRVRRKNTLREESVELPAESGQPRRRTERNLLKKRGAALLGCTSFFELN